MHTYPLDNCAPDDANDGAAVGSALFNTDDDDGAVGANDGEVVDGEDDGAKDGWLDVAVVGSIDSDDGATDGSVVDGFCDGRALHQHAHENTDNQTTNLETTADGDDEGVTLGEFGAAQLPAQYAQLGVTV